MNTPQISVVVKSSVFKSNSKSHQRLVWAEYESSHLYLTCKSESLKKGPSRVIEASPRVESRVTTLSLMTQLESRTQIQSMFRSHTEQENSCTKQCTVQTYITYCRYRFQKLYVVKKWALEICVSLALLNIFYLEIPEISHYYITLESDYFVSKKKKKFEKKINK